MVNLINPGDLGKNSDMALTFEGAKFGSSVSFFLIDAKPGDGPALHKHPYDETFIILAGTATLTIDGQELIVSEKQIAVVPKETPHKFTNSGVDRLRMISISPRGKMVTEWLE